MYLVRYADDFKIFTNSYDNARKIKIAVEKWLKERLGLEISEEKVKSQTYGKTVQIFRDSI